MPSCLLSAGIGSPLQWDELTASTKAEEQLDMSGLETRAARNMMIIATANKLARISWQPYRAPEHLPNIFRPSYTTKGNGTGLGLSRARQIAEEHHGRIEVTSEAGKGTKFLVALPVQQAPHKSLRRGSSLVLTCDFLSPACRGGVAAQTTGKIQSEKS